MPIDLQPDAQTSGNSRPRGSRRAAPFRAAPASACPRRRTPPSALRRPRPPSRRAPSAPPRRRRPARPGCRLRSSCRCRLSANVSARIRTRSTTPVKPRSSPIGSWIGTISRAQSRCSDSSDRSRLARSRSSRLSTTMRGRLSGGRVRPQLLGLHFDAGTESTTTTAASTTRSAERASVRKLAMPGVSMMLILVLSHSACARLEERECLRAMASSSKSVTVVPSSTLSQPVDGAGSEEHGGDKLGLAAPAVTDDGHVPDGAGVVDLHRGIPPGPPSGAGASAGRLETRAVPVRRKVHGPHRRAADHSRRRRGCKTMRDHGQVTYRQPGSVVIRQIRMRRCARTNV